MVRSALLVSFICCMTFSLVSIPPYLDDMPLSSHPITLSFSSYQTVSSWLKKGSGQPTPFTLKKADPATTVFAFDLHDVVVTPNLQKTFRLMAHMPHKFRLIVQFLNPWFVYDFIHLYRHNTFEDLVFQLSEKYHAFAQSQQSLFAIANAQRPQWGTLNIIKELKQRGFKIYLLSNIGQVMFNQLRDQCPEIFDSFDDFFVSSPAYGYVHKPDPLMFELFLQHFSLEARNVIFVDDKQANIQIAATLGIQGILFLSPEKLRHELEAIGALTTQPAVYKDELLSISYYFAQHQFLHHFA